MRRVITGKDLAGVDKAGNRYFRWNEKNDYGRIVEKREVDYASKDWTRPDQLPVEWTSWLRGTRTEPPSLVRRTGYKQCAVGPSAPSTASPPECGFRRRSTGTRRSGSRPSSAQRPSAGRRSARGQRTWAQPEHGPPRARMSGRSPPSSTPGATGVPTGSLRPPALTARESPQPEGHSSRTPGAHSQR